MATSIMTPISVSSAVEAMFAIMADITKVNDVVHVQIGSEESDLELALVTWPNNLLTEARMRGLIFSRFALQRNQTNWRDRGSP